MNIFKLYLKSLENYKAVITRNAKEIGKNDGFYIFLLKDGNEKKKGHSKLYEKHVTEVLRTRFNVCL